MTTPLVLAIDGPAGAGKSTVARRVAEALGWAHLDSGALFRALAATALARGVDPDDEAALATLARRVRVEPDDEGGVRVDGRTLGGRVRDADVSRAAPRLARHAAVRTAMARAQRAFALRAGRLVAEGRDMGTVVFPDARWKVFLEADASERARRRLEQERPEAAGDAEALGAVREAIEARDRADRGRAVAPLVPAEDAWILDTTRMPLDEVVAAVVAKVRSGIPAVPPPESPA